MKEYIRNHISLIISEETEKNLTKNLDYYKNITQEYDFTFSYNNRVKGGNIKHFFWNLILLIPILNSYSRFEKRVSYPVKGIQ